MEREKRYRNPHSKQVKKSLLDIVLWQCGYFDRGPERPLPPEDFAYPRPRQPLTDVGTTATWINHSTYMLSVDGVNILTDPIWGERCSPVPFIGPKRRHPPAIAIENLPTIHAVMVSHDHYDHLCKQSVRQLHARFPKMLWVVPKGLTRWFFKLGIHNVIEHAWWEQSSHMLGPNGVSVTFTAVPSQHFSGRKGWHNNSTLWAGWVAEFHRSKGANKRLYFVGDTGYNPHDFKRIGERFGEMDLSLIPIGTYVPLEFMAPVHICPEKAVEIHLEVNSKLSLGMHWKTFKLSAEGMDQPPYDLYLEMKKRDLNPTRFLPVEPGETVTW